MGKLGMGDTPIRTRYDWSKTAPSRAVIDAFAAIKNVRPDEIGSEGDFSLYDHVDPEALDELVGSDSPVAVSFTIEGYRIRFEGDTLIVSDDPDATP